MSGTASKHDDHVDSLRYFATLPMAARQSKLESAIETFFNIGSGFILSFLMWIFVVTPLFHIESSVAQSFWITTLFTITSVLRSYVWRRYFNARLHKRVHAALSKGNT